MWCFVYQKLSFLAITIPMELSTVAQWFPLSFEIADDGPFYLVNKPGDKCLTYRGLHTQFIILYCPKKGNLFEAFIEPVNIYMKLKKSFLHLSYQHLK